MTKVIWLVIFLGSGVLAGHLMVLGLDTGDVGCILGSILLAMVALFVILVEGADDHAA